MKTGNVTYGAERIPYQVVERPARRTLGIEVYPDGRVLVLIPAECDSTAIEEKLRLRARWISQQLAMFSRYECHAMPRQYLSGESHRYLGRQYRLRVTGNDSTISKEQVKLTRGELIVSAPNKLSPDKVKELLHRWYLNRAREQFDNVLTEVFSTFGRRGFTKPRVAVRDMSSRWGSLSVRGQMTLNSRLIQAPRPCIEYVITHELCHLIHRNHNPKFFALLSQILPDWQTRKNRLEAALL